MTSKILRSDNTPIPSIKSVVFTERINASADLRPGCVSSAYIDVTVYGAASSAPSAGEPLKYYQVDANGVETYIGTFYAEPSIQSRNTYSFVAYDIVSKLDVGFSERLLAIQANFPMELSDLVTEACSTAGVQLLTTNFPMHDMAIQSFYAEGLTCRDILSYAAEIACRYVKCDEDEKIVFGWYEEKENYRIFPTSQDGTETKIAYKQGGLSYQAYSVPNAGCVAVRPINTENAAYIYPASFSAVTATDPLLNGNVTLYNLIAVDDGQGGVTLSGDFTTTDTQGAVEIESDGGGSASNCLVISNNILLTNADSETMEAVAEWIYTAMITLPVYRPAKAELFPAENPFRAGDIVAVTDIQGISFVMPVMSMTVEQSVAVVEATGNRSYDQDYGNDTSKQLQNLSNSIVQIDRLKVGYAEIDEAVLGTLEANGINADWINTGALTVKDANDNIIFEADKDNETVKIAGWSADSEYLTSQGTWMPLKLGEGRILFGSRTNIEAWMLSSQIGAVTLSGNALLVGIIPNGTDGVGRLVITDNEGQANYYSVDVENYSGRYPELTVRHTLTGNVNIGSYTTNYDLNLNGVNLRTKADQIGNLTQLSTTAKTDLVSAINEVDGDITTVDGKVGTLSSLTTTDKSDIVSAVNEVNAKPIPTIGYLDDTTARSVTLGNGYAVVSPQSSLPPGAKIFSIAALEWSSSNRVSFVPYGANATYGYAVGEPGDTITGLKCRFWYEIGV